MNALVDDIITIFPELNEVFNELDIDKQRSQVMNIFFSNYLGEFNVDISNIKRVQLGQRVFSDDDQMVSKLNFLCAINSLIPNINLELFDLIIPSKERVISKVSYALNFYKFVDSLTTEIYEKINPHITARSEIRQICLQTDEIQDGINSTVTLKIPNVEQLIETARADCEAISKKNEEIIVERRVLQTQLQQTKSKIEIVLRKKRQSENTLSTIIEKLKVKKLTLDQSFNCDEQINLLSDKLSSLNNEVMASVEKTEQEIIAQGELVKLRDCLGERCETVKKINETLTRLNEMKNEKKSIDEDANVINLALNDAVKDIAEGQKKKVELEKSCSIELERLKNQIELRRRETEENRSKVKNLKKKKDCLQEMIKKCRNHENDIAATHKEYLIAENKLKEMEKKIVKARWETLNQYRGLALRIQGLKSEQEPNNV